jgi:hypothetical protein
MIPKGADFSDEIMLKSKDFRAPSDWPETDRDPGACDHRQIPRFVLK